MRELLQQICYDVFKTNDLKRVWFYCLYVIVIIIIIIIIIIPSLLLLINCIELKHCML